MTMTHLADFLANLGAASVTWFWVPLAAWTILWLLCEPILQSNRIHPGIRYRLAQATLLALPVGITFGAMYRFRPVAPPAIKTSEPGIVIEGGFVFEPLVMIAAPGPVSSGLSLWVIVGIAFILAVVIAGTGLVRFLHSRRGLIGIRKSSREQSGVLPDEDLRTITERMGIRRTVRVVAHPKASVPMTFGWRHPVIVLPEQFSAEQRHMALMHELVHIHRHDYIANLLELLTTGIFGIHPGVIRIRRACALLRELSCDAVLITDHHIPRRDYADLLFLCVDPRRRIHRLAVSMADRPSHIHHRIEAMKTSRMLTQTTRRIGIAGAFIAFIFGIVLISSSFSFATVDVPQIDPPDTSLLILDRLPSPVDGWETLSQQVANSVSTESEQETIRMFATITRYGRAVNVDSPHRTNQERMVSPAEQIAALLLETRFHPATHNGEPVEDVFYFVFQLSADGTVHSSVTNPARYMVPTPAGRESIVPLDTTQGSLRYYRDDSLSRESVSQESPQPSLRFYESDNGTRDPAAADTVIFEVVEQEPVPIGGLEGIQQRLVYPETAYRAGIEGRVFIQFVVPPDGIPQDIQIVRSLCTECDEAAVRAIQETRFEPGRQRGRAVHVRHSIPITFRLSEEATVDPPPRPPVPPKSDEVRRPPPPPIEPPPARP